MLVTLRTRAAEVDRMLLEALPEASRNHFVDALSRIATTVGVRGTGGPEQGLLAAE